MTQFGVGGGRGAEQQCRKRGGSSSYSSEDGGVTPLKLIFEGLENFGDLCSLKELLSEGPESVCSSNT
ncbi:hypothetical protein JOB18_020782 [Solea senegalensis]|uniref:Uncharacterized protein n=1 Tax=Solea senegalensis TaxID=28829 RepID=A0AAV6Q8S1_SOLSE|nr:hypothetical protein JOB18_020782 [Solea senegalensis]